jgi:hypothetical protein
MITGKFALFTFLFDFVYEAGLALSQARTRRNAYWFLGIAAVLLALVLSLHLR